MPEATEIGSRLRAARERRGWSREALAFHSGISWSAVAQIESGRRRNVRPNTLSALSDALGVSLDYLARGRAPRAPMLEHRALIYDGNEGLLDVAGPFLEEGSERGEAMLAVISRPKIALFRKRLGPAVKSVKFVESARVLTTPSAALELFREFRDASLDGGAPWVRVVGEPIWEGRSDSEADQWTRFESLFNLVFAASPMSVICPYDAGSLDAEIIDAAHLTHPETLEAAGAVSSPDYADPRAFVLDPREAGPS